DRDRDDDSAPDVDVDGAFRAAIGLGPDGADDDSGSIAHMVSLFRSSDAASTTARASDPRRRSGRAAAALRQAVTSGAAPYPSDGQSPRRCARIDPTGGRAVR